MDFQEQHNFNFLDAFPAEWKLETAPPVMATFYASSLLRHPDGQQIVNLIVETAGALTPTEFKIICLQIIDAQVFTVSRPIITYQEAGRTVLLKSGQEQIPPGDYLCIAAPMTTEVKARETVSVVRGVAVTLFGHTAADIESHSLQINQNGTVSRVSDVIENHLWIDRFRFLPPEMTQALHDRSKFMNKDCAQRLATAMTFVARTAGEIDPIVRFSSLWIALEIISNGKPDRVLKRLNGAQNLRGILRQLDRARNELFHSGVHPSFSQDAERVLMLAILVEPLRAVGVSDHALQQLYARLEKEEGRPVNSFTDVAIR